MHGNFDRTYATTSQHRLVIAVSVRGIPFDQPLFIITSCLPFITSYSIWFWNCIIIFPVKTRRILRIVHRICISVTFIKPHRMSYLKFLPRQITAESSDESVKQWTIFEILVLPRRIDRFAYSFSEVLRCHAHGARFLRKNWKVHGREPYKGLY